MVEDHPNIVRATQELRRNAMIPARFWSRVARCSHGPLCVQCCWPWRGATSNGYGKLKYHFGPDDIEVMAHRVAWRLWYGQPFPPGLESCHTCDQHGCCNPAHVRPDTHQVNIQECYERGRLALRGEHARQAKLTDAKVTHIWFLHVIQRETQRTIAAQLGVSQVSVHHVLTGRTWKHVPIPVFTGMEGDQLPLL